MNILIVTHYYNTHGGGVEIVAGNIAASLLEFSDVNITWAASDIDDLPEDVNGASFLPMRSWNVAEEKIGIPWPMWGAGSLVRLFKGVKRSDLVHIHDYIYPGNLAAYVFAVFLRKPVVITQHIGHIPYKNVFFRRLLTFLNAAIGKAILKHTSKTVFISETVRKYFFDKEKEREAFSEFITNGVDTSIFNPGQEGGREGLRREFGFFSGDRVFLFVGRFVEKKGLHILKELAERFSSVKWVFAGWGPIDPKDWGLENVRVFDRPPKETIVSLYRISDLLVLPSSGEGFPLVVQETMACGTPAAVNGEVAAAYTPLKDLVLVLNRSDKCLSDAWSEGIERIVDDMNILSALRKPVFDFARMHWSWGITAQKYKDIFDEIINK